MYMYLKTVICKIIVRFTLETITCLFSSTMFMKIQKKTKSMEFCLKHMKYFYMKYLGHGCKNLTHFC